MMRLTPAAAALTALLLGGCASDGPEPPTAKQSEVYMDGLGGRGTVLRAGTSANAVYAEAIGMKAQGNCPGAVPKLRQVANLGVGYENAQTALGECLLQATGSSELSADYLEGLIWLRRAGEAGWPEAQFRLATIHALGPKAIRNDDEAGYWFALFNTNTGKSRVGFVAPTGAQVAALDSAISTAAKKSGAERAAKWERKVWTPPKPTPAPCMTGRTRRRGDGPGT